MTTFERLYIADPPATHEEVKGTPYYTWYNEEAACRRILAEFGLPGTSHIVNGHVPVREKRRREPHQGAGPIWSISDGGFCRAYHEKDRHCRVHAGVLQPHHVPCGPISPLSVPKRP